MKLLFVTRSIPLHSGSGGMEQVSWNLAKKLSEKAVVEVLTTSVPDETLTFVHEGIRVSTITGTTPGRYSQAWWIGTARFGRAKNFDVIMSVSAGGTAMVFTQAGPRYIFQAHGTALSELKNVLTVRPRFWMLKAARFTYWLLLDSLTYRRVSAVIAASDQVGGHLRKWPYGGAWKHTNLQVIRNAIDTDHMRVDVGLRDYERGRLHFSDSDVIVVTVSRLDKQKGVDRAVAAVMKLPSHVKLLVGGTGPVRGDLEASSDPAKVLLLGELDREGVRNTLAAADVFVLPVRNFSREALPLSVLEALAMGLRIIVPIGSQWPSDLVPLLDFVDVADAVVLAAAIGSVGSSGSVGSALTSRKSRLPDGYSLDAWADAYLRVSHPTNV